MALSEIEFELPAEQFAAMGYPQLRQGEPLDVILDGGVLLPDPATQGWYAVQPEELPAKLVRVGRGAYAFSGRISEADITKDDGLETAVVTVACGEVSLRVTCAPQDDGHLPYGVWETRYLGGLCRLQGIVEDDFAAPIGTTVGVTLWGVRRLILTPGDPNFGVWHESNELLPTPYIYDKVLLDARIHRLTL